MAFNAWVNSKLKFTQSKASLQNSKLFFSGHCARQLYFGGLTWQAGGHLCVPRMTSTHSVDLCTTSCNAMHELRRFASILAFWRWKSWAFCDVSSNCTRSSQARTKQTLATQFFQNTTQKKSNQQSQGFDSCTLPLGPGQLKAKCLPQKKNKNPKGKIPVA